MDGHAASHPVEETTVQSSTELLASLQARASVLLTNLKTYQDYLQEHGKSNAVELRLFKRGVESEVKSLATITDRNAAGISERRKESSDNEEHEEQETKCLHALRSSNLPFYEAVWDSARRCRSITALGKRMYSTPPQGVKRGQAMKLETEDGRLPEEKPQRKGVLVDIVAENGLEWIKVSTITEKRLLFEMAKEGWEGYGDYSDEDSNCSGGEDDSCVSQKRPKANKLDLVRLAEELRDAAQSTRVGYQHPTVHFRLPKIREGIYEDVDGVIEDLRSTGATVHCGNSADSESLDDLSTHFDDRLHLRPEHLHALLPHQASPTLTHTLNIDCTILLALISDISHLPRSALPTHPHNNISKTYHTAILRQIDAEHDTPLLPHELYPLLRSRALVCTDLAAARMADIVATMGTPAERARADIFLGWNAFADKSPAELRQALAAYSWHPVPESLMLPIRYVVFDYETDRRPLASIPAAVAARLPHSLRLSPINQSVFMYGWTQGIVTLTSNRVVANGIVRALGEILDDEERREEEEEVGGDGVKSKRRVQEVFQGPEMYVCETARSLIGKEKQGGR